MKIFLVNNLFGPQARGGAERVVEIEARTMGALGHDVTVLSEDPAAPRLGALGEDRGLKHLRYSVPGPFSYQDLGKHAWPLRAFWHVHDTLNFFGANLLGQIVAREKPDVVHTHNLMGLGFPVPRILARDGVRHVHTVHDVQLLDPSGLIRAHDPLRLAPHQWAYSRAMREMLQSPPVVLFPSAYHRAIHMDRGFFPESRVEVLRNPAPYHLRGGNHGRGEREPVFLFVGQVEEYKGVFDLLEAWKEAALPGAVLEIVGTGGAQAKVNARAAKIGNVRIMGRLEGDALEAAYDRASWVVVPSRVIENAPNVIVEAFSRGVPAVASETGGIPEFVRDGESGFLYPPGDVAMLSAAMRKAHTLDFASRARFSNTAGQTVARLAADAHAAKLLEYYADSSAKPAE